MHSSVATANFYFLPFAQTLEIIAEAGFAHIELDLYWESGKWAMAQHLKDIPVREVVRLVNQSGLTVSSIHDGGGVIEDPHTARGFANPQLAAYLDQLGYAPGCIVFHTPHRQGGCDKSWWQSISDKIARIAESYRSSQTSVTLENMPIFDGYYVPLTTPQELFAFVSERLLGVTLDTTHYAQMGIDVVEAARILKEKIRTIHLSDYLNGKPHVFIGEGSLDFVNFFRVLEFSTLRSVTLECSMGFLGETAFEMDPVIIIDRLRTARSRLHAWIEAAQ